MVFGSGCIRYSDQPIEEHLYHPDGAFWTVRHRMFTPDLKHEHVKLGWWNG